MFMLKWELIEPLTIPWSPRQRNATMLTIGKNIMKNCSRAHIKTPICISVIQNSTSHYIFLFVI